MIGIYFIKIIVVAAKTIYYSKSTILLVFGN